MAIPKRRLVDWRDDWDPDEWWQAFGFAWLVIACAVDATESLRARQTYYDEWERVGGFRNRLVEALNELDARHGGRAPRGVRVGLSTEIEALDRERAALSLRYRNRAWDKATLEQTLWRRLLERGVQPSTFAAWKLDSDDKSEIHESSERVTMQTMRVSLRRHYAATLAVYIDLFEDAKAGLNVFVPIGEVFCDRHGRRYRARWATPMELAREIGRLTELIEHLSARSDEVSCR